MIETLTYVVSTLVTYGLGILSKKKGWNETLPIPVQNIVVAVLVFFISALYIRLTNQEVALSDILKQIFLSVGGSGTAALYYDARKENA